MTNLAVIYYSATGSVHALAQALADGASGEGATVRLRRVPELAPAAAIDANPAWRDYVDNVAPGVPEATLEDLEWADGYAFGTPSRFGTPAAQLKQFIDTTGGLWQQGTLAGKPVTTFVSAINRHGGAEATILSLNNVFYHWGSILVPPGYTDSAVYGAGGNPYGTAHTTGMPAEPATEQALVAARYQGARLARIAAALSADTLVAAG
ncbi:NAD(P)H:quinone oxidoreductase [Epidermidibacterium keratini]|uniref:NAD(P)H:quinone oxidoreductase n=1 Tax=Epidermidibacterium keratini TaxID=1891644 RepID=A0A7L4YNP7_9ACTN|nr:NAD(P)H:quinone oxidoreductase [Epidermidibacterium keratini]QHC00780.1 NAD(P)H:quinone oxidoreductase [Epidermidibacterium keratini]